MLPRGGFNARVATRGGAESQKGSGKRTLGGGRGPRKADTPGRRAHTERDSPLRTWEVLRKADVHREKAEDRWEISGQAGEGTQYSGTRPHYNSHTRRERGCAPPCVGAVE